VLSSLKRDAVRGICLVFDSPRMSARPSDGTRRDTCAESTPEAGTLPWRSLEAAFQRNSHNTNPSFPVCASPRNTRILHWSGEEGKPFLWARNELTSYRRGFLRVSEAAPRCAKWTSSAALALLEFRHVPPRAPRSRRVRDCEAAPLINSRQAADAELEAERPPRADHVSFLAGLRNQARFVP
jgi:hypothetical protein